MYYNKHVNFKQPLLWSWLLLTIIQLNYEFLAIWIHDFVEAIHATIHTTVHKPLLTCSSLRLCPRFVQIECLSTSLQTASPHFLYKKLRHFHRGKSYLGRKEKYSKKTAVKSIPINMLLQENDNRSWYILMTKNMEDGKFCVVFCGT